MSGNKYMFIGKIDFKLNKIILSCATTLLLIICMLMYLTIDYPPIMFGVVFFTGVLMFMDIDYNERNSTCTLTEKEMVLRVSKLFGIIVKEYRRELTPQIEEYLEFVTTTEDKPKTFNFVNLDIQYNLKIIFKNKNLVAPI